MTLKEALQAHAQSNAGRARRCRICALLDTLPAEDAQALRDYMDPRANLGPRPIAAALEAEGFPGLYHSVKNHLYLCAVRP